MNYRFFTNSQKTWQAMFQVISSAKLSIYFEMYIFQNDIVDFNFFDLLKEKARSGLKVKMILDSFGSMALKNKDAIELKESGVELIFLSHFLYRAHRKILIIDENIAFVGGVNFHQSASLWNDLMVRVDGKLVSLITKSFAKVYKQCGGRDPSLLIYSQKVIKDKINDWIIEHFPIRNKFVLKRIYKKHIFSARESITLVTPYFIPKRWLVGALQQAYLRGVSVEILVPQNTDHYFIDRVNYFFINKLSKLGINFYIEPKMNHAKIMMIDGKEAIVGSNNLDYLSFELNSEVGIFFNDKSALNEISKIIVNWKKDAVSFDNKIYKIQWLDYILYPIISLFFKIL